MSDEQRRIAYSTFAANGALAQQCRECGCTSWPNADDADVREQTHADDCAVGVLEQQLAAAIGRAERAEASLEEHQHAYLQAVARAERAEQERDGMRAALERARHALATLTGLTASDGLDAYEDSLERQGEHHVAWDDFADQAWQIDEAATIAQIDAALAVTAPAQGGGTGATE